MEILFSIQSKSDGSTREVKRDIGEGLAVGRGAEEGILLDGPDLSREHLVITTDGTHIYVTDLSNNGTWLNGSRLRRSLRTRVRPEEVIDVPGYSLTFHLAEQPEESKDAADVAIIRSPQANLEQAATSVAPAASSAGPMAMLDPVFRFIGSFTFAEKALVIVAGGGLLLIYSYFGA